MLAIYCDRATPNSCCEIDGVCFNGRAKDLFDEAIEIGKREFQTSNTDDEKADFAQQLANRHFNRGVFLLLTKDDPCAAADARESGYKDLMEAQQLDSDVDDYWLQKKLMFKNSAEYFERIVRRLLGLIVLSSDMRVRDIWDCRELLKDLDSLLFAAWDQPHAPLFRDLDRTGRLQQLEDVAIRMETSLKNHVEAARLAMRMLIEDEYILESAFLSAATALLTYTTLGQAVQWSTETIVSSKADLRKILKSCKGSSLDAGKCLVVCLELSEAWKDSPLLSKISDSCLLLYDEYFNDNDYISAVSSREDVDESFRLELNRKGVQNRTQFEAVTRYTGGATLQATIPIAVQMLADKPECRDNDTYVIAVIDSASWGSFSPEAIRHQVDRMNRERDTVINIIIIGLDIQSQEVRESCVELCMVSKASIFLEATADTIDALFDQVSLIITKQSACGTMLGGITMEKF